jgi:hypothetical protein
MLGNPELLKTYADQFRVELDVLQYWMDAWLRVLANAFQYSLETDPKGIRSTFLEMYLVAVKTCGEHVISQGYDLSRRDFRRPNDSFGTHQRQARAVHGHAGEEESRWRPG